MFSSFVVSNFNAEVMIIFSLFHLTLTVAKISKFNCSELSCIIFALHKYSRMYVIFSPNKKNSTRMGEIRSVLVWKRLLVFYFYIIKNNLKISLSHESHAFHFFSFEPNDLSLNSSISKERQCFIYFSQCFFSLFPF
jgi:hypothetical protein